MSEEPKESKLPPDLEPTQEQLRKLRDLVFEYEPEIGPLDGIPEGIDLTQFEILAGPPTFDETMAPASTLRALDKRVVWVSVFRNPDTNAVIRQHIMVVDPPINRAERDELPREDYDLIENGPNHYNIIREDAPPMTRPEVDALVSLIRDSKKFNAFLETADDTDF
jgi:hypothetical protein